MFTLSDKYASSECSGDFLEILLPQNISYKCKQCFCPTHHKCVPLHHSHKLNKCYEIIDIKKCDHRRKTIQFPYRNLRRSIPLTTSYETIQSKTVITPTTKNNETPDSPILPPSKQESVNHSLGNISEATLQRQMNLIQIHINGTPIIEPVHSPIILSTTPIYKNSFQLGRTIKELGVQTQDNNIQPILNTSTTALLHSIKEKQKQDEYINTDKQLSVNQTVQTTLTSNYLDSLREPRSSEVKITRLPEITIKTPITFPLRSRQVTASTNRFGHTLNQHQSVSILLPSEKETDHIKTLLFPTPPIKPQLSEVYLPGLFIDYHVGLRDWGGGTTQSLKSSSISSSLSSSSTHFDQEEYIVVQGHQRNDSKGFEQSIAEALSCIEPQPENLQTDITEIHEMTRGGHLPTVPLARAMTIRRTYSDTGSLGSNRRDSLQQFQTLTSKEKQTNQLGYPSTILPTRKIIRTNSGVIVEEEWTHIENDPLQKQDSLLNITDPYYRTSSQNSSVLSSKDIRKDSKTLSPRSALKLAQLRSRSLSGLNLTHPQHHTYSSSESEASQKSLFETASRLMKSFK